MIAQIFPSYLVMDLHQQFFICKVFSIISRKKRGNIGLEQSIYSAFLI